MTVRDIKLNPGNILCSSGDDSGIYKSAADMVSATYHADNSFILNLGLHVWKE